MTFKNISAAFLSIVLLLAATFSLTGCSDGEPSGDEPAVTDDDKEPDNSTAPRTTTSAPEPATPASTEEAVITEPPRPDEPDDTPFTADNSIADTAYSLLGIPFAEGGDTPNGFDNSGFIYYVLRQNGYVNCPRSLSEQSVMGNKIDSISGLLSGDLVFFSESGEKPQFGGIYIGDGVMITCRMPGEEVREINIMNDYYKGHFYAGVRVL